MKITKSELLEFIRSSIESSEELARERADANDFASAYRYSIEADTYRTLEVEIEEWEGDSS